MLPALLRAGRSLKDYEISSFSAAGTQARCFSQSLASLDGEIGAISGAPTTIYKKKVKLHTLCFGIHF